MRPLRMAIIPYVANSKLGRHKLCAIDEILILLYLSRYGGLLLGEMLLGV